MKKFYLLKSNRNFARILSDAKGLEKELAWVPIEKNNMNNLVIFFKKIVSVEEKITSYGEVKCRNHPKKVFVTQIKKLLINIKYGGRCKYFPRHKKEVPNIYNIFIKKDGSEKNISDILSQIKNQKYISEISDIEKEIISPFMRRKYEVLIKILMTYRFS
jgi:hypothetical protein